MNNSLQRVMVIAFATLAHLQLMAQDTTPETIDFADMTLEELMNIEMTVASTKALSPRESPGVVTLITSDQIERTGARDLIDVLRMVPGFEFAVDVQGIVGVGLRGNWGHEGKILILLDGQETNERLYATSQLGHHFPVSQIDRIEIIRGPGSATYGGYAELGVINIITKKGTSLNGGAFSTTYGSYENTVGRASGSFMIGNGDEDLSYDIKGFYQTGNRSDRLYTDVYGDSYSMNGNSEIQTTMLNAGLTVKGFETRIIYENYVLQARDLFDAILPEPLDMSFQAIYTDFKYNWKVSDKTTITPRFRYKNQSPWISNDNTAETLDASYSGAFYDKSVSQITGSILTNSDISDKVNVITGVDYYVDNATSTPGYEFSATNTTDFSIYNFSVYGQGLFKLDFANLTVGARFNQNEYAGSAFVPRLGITRVFGDFHTKFLFSQAFRSPSVENIDTKNNILPELTTVFEIEAGYKLTDNMHINANLFSININDPIVYFYDSNTGNDGYDNFNSTGTKGFELEYLYKDSWGLVSLNYSYYTAGGNNKVLAYSVPGDDNQLLGFAQNKFNMAANFNLNKSLTFNTTLTYLGERSGFPTVDVSDEPVLETFDSQLFLNFYLNWRNVLTDGLTAGAGVYNVTNNDYAYIQPYNSGHAPLPAAGREFLVRLTYNFNFK